MSVDSPASDDCSNGLQMLHHLCPGHVNLQSMGVRFCWYCTNVLF